MSEYGVRIQNIQCASIYECNLGVRQQLDCKDAVITNSLFLDFLYENGLKVWNGKSTRDLIVLEYGYGTRNYKQERQHFDDIIANTEAALDDENLSAKSREKLEKKLENVLKLSADCDTNKDLYQKISKQDLRTITYRDGISVTYYKFSRNNSRKVDETIHYKMLTRTPGKAKTGRVTFVREELYEKCKDFLYMDIDLPEHNAPIVELGAYSSLITSGIIGRIQIKPEQILVVKDVKSFFKTNVISVETNERNECIAVERDNYEVSNELFDGQALLDASMFPSWGNSFLLLRNHFFKAAAFKTYIQKFFKDYCFANNIDYEAFTVKDMWGNLHLAKDIMLITTNNATKWLKFDVSFEQWIDKLKWNDYLFGVVKTEHASKTYPHQKMSYQMVNTLNMNCMSEAMLTTHEYIEKLQTNDDAFLKYLDKNKNFSNDFEVLIALVKQDRDFLRSEYFRERKKKIIATYVLNVKSGKLIQNADNEVIVGSPYAMLLHTVGEDVANDPTFEHEEGCIQCWTSRFKDGEYLAAFRSPHNARSNILYLHNHHHEFLTKYFDFSDYIIAVNLQHTDFQDRANGSDQDSDMCYVTNSLPIVYTASDAYHYNPTIVNNVSKDKTCYDNTPEDFAVVDNKLAASQLGIGSSSNLAQICLSYTYSFENKKYSDYACILSVIAQICIDSAKRVFSIDPVKEIERIKRDMDINENRHPTFWLTIRPEFKRFKTIKGEKASTINHGLICPMNELTKFKPHKHRTTEETLPMSVFFVKYNNVGNVTKNRKVEELIQKYAFNLYNHQSGETEVEDNLLMMEDFDELIEDIQKIYISNNYLPLMSYLINRAFLITPAIQSNKDNVNTSLNKNRAILLKTLYYISPEQLLQVFSGNL